MAAKKKKVAEVLDEVLETEAPPQKTYEDGFRDGVASVFVRMDGMWTHRTRELCPGALIDWMRAVVAGDPVQELAEVAQHVHAKGEVGNAKIEGADLLVA